MLGLLLDCFVQVRLRVGPKEREIIIVRIKVRWWYDQGKGGCDLLGC